MTVEHLPPPLGDKRNDTHYWPTAKAYDAVGATVPEFIVRRDALAAGERTSR